MVRNVRLLAISSGLLAATLSCAPLPKGKQSASQPSAAELQVLRGWFPKATQFAVKPIPSRYQRDIDRSANTYVVAADARGRVVGYTRRLVGPVSEDAACDCSPLDVTLVFAQDRELKLLHAHQPLQKLGHALLSLAEQEELTAIVRHPSSKLLAVDSVTGIVDARSGATKPHLAPVVLPQAGLSTKRLAQFAEDTRRVLLEAPIEEEEERLRQRLHAASDDRERVGVLHDFVVRTPADSLRNQATRQLIRTYGRLLGQGGETQLPVESLLFSRLAAAPESLLVPMEHLCLERALAPESSDITGRCLEELPQAGSTPATLEHLKVPYLAKREAWKAAHASLLNSLKGRDVRREPEWFAHVVRVFSEVGRTQRACQAAKQHAIAHPKFPDNDALLSACADSPTSTRDSLRQRRRAELFGLRLTDGIRQEPLDLETIAGELASLRFADAGQVTVIAFFATWCPHCEQEMPQLVAFQKRLQEIPALRRRVRLVGVRTAVERETIPYEAFVGRHGVNFPIYVDATMSLGFSAFVRRNNLPPQLPTLAVVGPQGVLQYVVPTGGYRDVAQDLAWISTQLVSERGSAAGETTAR